MSDAASLPDPPTQASRFAPLLTLVHKLIDYGRQLAASLQQPAPPADFDNIAIGFGTYDLTAIVARIIRGLHRATALASRLQRLETTPEPDPAATPAMPPRASRAATAPMPRPPRAAAIVAAAPTPEQIAAKVQRQPIGEVFADICRDLGILPGHPLWHDLFLAIVRFGGRLGRLCVHISNRALAARTAPKVLTASNAVASPCAQPPLRLATTGPPV